MEAGASPVRPLTSAGKAGAPGAFRNEAEGRRRHPQGGERRQHQTGDRKPGDRGMQPAVATTARRCKDMAPAAGTPRKKRKPGDRHRQHRGRPDCSHDPPGIIEEERTVKIGQPALQGRRIGTADGCPGRGINHGCRRLIAFVIVGGDPAGRRLPDLLHRRLRSLNARSEFRHADRRRGRRTCGFERGKERERRPAERNDAQEQGGDQPWPTVKRPDHSGTFPLRACS